MQYPQLPAASLKVFVTRPDTLQARDLAPVEPIIFNDSVDSVLHGGIYVASEHVISLSRRLL